MYTQWSENVSEVTNYYLEYLCYTIWLYKSAGTDTVPTSYMRVEDNQIVGCRQHHAGANTSAVNAGLQQYLEVY